MFAAPKRPVRTGAIPPPPAGFNMVQQDEPEDPVDVLRREGFVATNGYRTDADTQRIRAQGYKPADNSLHETGDGIDWTHPKLPMPQAERRIREVMGEGWTVLNEGHHVHTQKPGYGRAPGTPGTDRFGLPPLPPGFELVQRGSLTDGNYTEDQAQRIATLDMGLQRGDMTPDQHRQFVAEVKSGRSLADNPAQIVDVGGVVMFRDEQPETPATKLAPEDEPTLLEFLSKGDIAGARRFRESKGVFGTDNFDEVVAALKEGAQLPKVVQYNLPEVQKAPGGAGGAFARGVGDPFNVLDETGGVVDTLGLTSGRENIWNSDRGFVDVLNSNIDLNRGILKADDEQHWKARLGGQLLTGFALPIGLKANTPAQLARIGAAEGAAAGFGAGEGNPLQRLPMTIAGATAGAIGGGVIGKGIEVGAPLLRRAWAPINPPVAREAAFEAAPLVNDTMQSAGPTPAAKTQPQGGVLGREGEVVTSDPVPASPVIGPGDLWTLGREELERLQRESSASENEKLVEALGEEGAKRFLRLDRMRNSSSPQQADEASRLFDEEFGNLTPDQERLVYGIGETEAQADEIAAVLREHQPYTEFEDRDLIDVIRRTVIEQRDPKWLDRVKAGTGLASEQAGFVRLMGALDAFKQRGKSLGDLPADLMESLQARGWSAADAEEVLSSRLDGLRRPMAATQGAALGGPGVSAAMRSDMDPPALTGPAPRERDYIDTSPPPPPPGFQMVDGVGVTALRQFRPENVRPIPGNRPTSAEELPTSLAAIAAPRPGRAPKKPGGFVDHLKATLRTQSAEKGLPVRIDAEDAIDKGVPAELIYVNPNEADRARLRLRNPSVFGTRYGKMSDTRQVLRSLDMDDVDPAQWGFENNLTGRLDPEEIGDLIRRDLEGDSSALERGSEFDEWTAYQDRLEQRAEFDGRFPDGPPVQQVGEPIGPEDLDNMVPPDSAYEDAPRLVARVGNLNLERVDNPEEVSRLVQHITANVPELAKASGPRLANAELKNIARDLAVKPSQILAWNKDKGLPPPAELFAWRVIIHQGRQKVAALAKRTKGASDAELAKFHNTVMKQAALERQLAGAAAESGRLLQQFNAIAAAGDMTDQAIKAYLRGAGGRETVEEMADAIVDLVKDPKGTGKFIKDAPRVRTRDMANELWVNGLLSGVGTHLVNFGGNGLVALLTLPEEAITAGIGRVMGSTDRAHLRDVGARAAGMIQGAKEGLRLARIAFRTGEPSDGVSKVEARNYQAIPGRLGQVIRTPSRALTAADEFWGEMHYRGAVAAGAMRRALNEGGGKDKVMARYEALKAAPDGDLIKFARGEALYRTFRKPLGKAGRAVQQFSNEAPGAKLIIPFVRTPINIIKYGGERSVLAPLAKPFWKDIQAGGRTRDEALGKLMMGAGLSAWAMDAALNGRISGGGPADPQEKAALRNSGWQPYSVKIGDTWVSYQRFEPLSLIIGATADFAELGTWAAGKEADDVAMGISLAVAKNITSKTWVSGLSDFFEVLSDPERYGKGWVQRMAGTMAAPPVIGNAARAADEDVREVRSVLDAIKNRIPVLSRDLEARRDVWGEPLKRGSGAGQGPITGTLNYINPVYYSRESKDPLRREVARLKAPLSMPQRSLRIDGQTVKLTPEQFGAYVELSGKPAKQYLDGYIQTAEWRRMGDEDRKEFLKETLTEFRDIARGELKRLYPELNGAPPPPPPPGFSPVQ